MDSHEVVGFTCRGTHRLLAAALATTSENGNGAVEMAAAALPPRYVDFKEQIRTEMFTIKQKMNELKQLHGRAALTSFDDTDSHEVEIEVVTQEITRLFRKCEARLQQFTTGTSASEADDKVRQHPDKTLRPGAVILCSTCCTPTSSKVSIG